MSSKKPVPATKDANKPTKSTAHKPTPMPINKKSGGGKISKKGC